MQNSKTVKYDYKCPFCKKWFKADEHESFHERACPECGKTVIPEPPGLSKGPLVKVNLDTPRRRLLAVMLGYSLGMLGAHKFVLNYNMTGVIMLFASVALASLNPALWIPVWLVAALEATIYLITPDETFEKRYIKGKRYWF